MTPATTVAKPAKPAAERERAIGALRAMEAELRRRGVSGVTLYGSLARGKATPASDIDLLLSVALGARFSLIEMSDVRLLVTDRLGRDAAVVVDDDLAPEIRARTDDGLVRVF
jgi:predicted nucleotidyltransferase